MTLSRSDWKAYIDRLAKINERAGALMQQYIDANGYEDTQRLIAYAYALATKYGGAASSLACEMYDALALAQGAVLPAAEPAETAAFGEVAKAVRGTMKNGRNSVPDTVSRLVKQAGADTTVKNALRDGAEWAWIPSGDTCAFCLTLASRGWQKASKKTLRGDHAEHIHAHCNCEFAIRFDGKSTVAGYDPDAYREAYDHAEGSTPKEKINALRRDWYAGNKEKINQQKRAAYAAKSVRTKQIASVDKGVKAGIIEGEYDTADIRRAITQESTNFVIRDIDHPDSLYGEACEKIPRLKGFYDVKMHGSPDLVKVFNSPVDAEELARIILMRRDYNGEPIRLLSCETGKLENNTCVAKELSRLLGVDVLAPTEVLRVSDSGMIKIVSDERERGWMRLFHPDGRYEDYI